MILCRLVPCIWMTQFPLKSHSKIIYAQFGWRWRKNGVFISGFGRWFQRSYTNIMKMKSKKKTYPMQLWWMTFAFLTPFETSIFMPPKFGFMLMTIQHGFMFKFWLVAVSIFFILETAYSLALNYVAVMIDVHLLWAHMCKSTYLFMHFIYWSIN